MTKVTSNQDLYALVRSLIDHLEDAGERTWATELRDAMASSSLAGEVLGELRVALIALERESVASRLGVQDEVGSAVGYIDTMIGF